MGGSARGGGECPTSPPHLFTTHAVTGARPYLAFSAHRSVRAAEALDLAGWFGLDPVSERPLPVDRPGLVLTGAGPTLRVPGHRPMTWHPGMTAWRLASPETDPLLRALALRPGERVLDGTLGFGHDALVLRAAGAVVIGVERSPLLALLTFLAHGERPLGPPLQLRLGRVEDVLADLPTGAVEHVYLDPRFPDAAGRRSFTLAPMRALCPEAPFEESWLRLAVRVARRRVVVKLAPLEVPRTLDGVVPAIVRSTRVRFAVYRARDSA
ncbi:class I SAM-dependent methyltransferase [Myxococcota bacterium]|nr:class I SAM-dependent methyltransferase [Myxococcota bacterium]